MNLSERLREALLIAGKSQTQLAVETGLSTSAVSQWMTGNVKALKGETAAKIEAATGVCATWLVTGTGPKLLTERSNVSVSAVGARRIPLISYVQAGTWTSVTDSYHPGAGEDYLLTDRDVSYSTFALEIKGDSMLPEFKEGDRVIIDPNVAPQPGDFVVAKNGEHEATFKKYRPRGVNERGDTIFELVPLNEDFPSLRSDVNDVHIVGTMVEHRKYRRR